MAVSDDLWSWSKYPGDGSPTFIPDRELSGWREEGMMECKDPSIIYQDGRYHMYYVCQKLVEPIDEPERQTHAAINLATSTDLIHWEDHGHVIEDKWIWNPLAGPPGFETPRAVQYDGKIYMFAMHFPGGLHYTVGDDPFHFGPWHVVGPWHAPVIFNDDEDRWYITHTYNPFGKLTTRRPKAGPWRGLYIAGLEWSEGVPVPVDLRAVMEDWPWQREGGG
jgi:beta-xylosidase